MIVQRRETVAICYPHAQIMGMSLALCYVCYTNKAANNYEENTTYHEEESNYHTRVG